MVDADIAAVDNRSGRNDPPTARTQYAKTNDLTRGGAQRTVEEHQAAHRRPITIDAATGQALFSRVNASLGHIAAADARHPDLCTGHKAATLDAVVQGHEATGAPHAGHLGGGVVLGAPEGQLGALTRGISDADPV
jgi:hypothetical protein